jgi:hypothetical protein
MASQHQGALGRRRRPLKQPFGLLEGRQRIGFPAGLFAVGAEPGQQDGGPDRLHRPIHGIEGPLHQAGGPLRRSDEGGRLGRPGQQADPVKPTRLARLGHPPPQREGPLVVVVRLGKGPGPLGRQASPDPGRQGLRPLTGRVPVDGHLGRSHRRRGIGQLRPLGQRAGIGGMQPRPFAGHQVGLDDLTQQGVAQLVAVLARPGHQQLIGDRRAERLHQGLVLQAGDLGQEPVGDPPASHRHHPKHLPCQLGQRLDPAAEQIPQCRWQLTGAGPDGPEQLLGEIRVALRVPKDRIHQLGGRCRPHNPDQLS